MSSTSAPRPASSLSLDRGQSWRRLRANLPTVRVDEITLHPRDNAMLVATHGRSLFILDHLEPIQEYQSAQMAPAEAKLYSVPTGMQWKSKDDRNEEFWGHQFFLGENPPAEAVIQFQVNLPVDELSLRVSDAQGKTIREMVAPESRRQPGIRTMCWDMRHQPIAPPEAPGGSGQARAGAAGRGGGGGARAEIPGVPTPLADAGYLPANPCSGQGGGGDAGPFVTPGTYQVSLVVNGSTVDTKPMQIVKDPGVDFSGVERVAYDETLLTLHELQRRGTEVAGHLDEVYAQVVEIDTSGAIEDVPGDVRAEFTAFQEAFDELRVKFGVPMSGGGGGRNFGRGGDPANLLARTSTLKRNISSFWEVPSDALVNQFYEVTPLLEMAIGEAQETLERARALARMLEDHEITLTVPPSGG